MKHFLLTLIVFAATILFSQNNYDSRLEVKYSQEYLQNLDEQKIKSLEFELTNSYFIINNNEKSESFPILYKYNNKTIIDRYSVEDEICQ